MGRSINNSATIDENITTLDVSSAATTYQERELARHSPPHTPTSPISQAKARCVLPRGLQVVSMETVGQVSLPGFARNAQITMDHGTVCAPWRIPLVGERWNNAKLSVCSWTKRVPGAESMGSAAEKPHQQRSGIYSEIQSRAFEVFSMQDVVQVVGHGVVLRCYRWYASRLAIKSGIILHEDLSS